MKPGHDHEQQQDHAEDPQHLARLLVGAVIHAAEHVDVGGEEEHRRAVRVQVAQQPAVVHVAHDLLDGIEGEVDMRRVVHRQHDAGDDLHAEHEGEDAAERPPVVQVARRRIDDEGGIDQPGDRQPPLHPLHECALRLVGRMSAHGRTLRDEVERPSADPDLGVGEEFVGRQREVHRRGSLPDAAGSVVMRAVAGAEIAVVVALMRRAGCSRDGCRCRSAPATGRGPP